MEKEIEKIKYILLYILIILLSIYILLWTIIIKYNLLY